MGIFLVNNNYKITLMMYILDWAMKEDKYCMALLGTTETQNVHKKLVIGNTCTFLGDVLTTYKGVDIMMNQKKISTSSY